MSNDATLKDSTHELFVYKCEDKNKLNPEQYLKLASNMQEANEMSSSVAGYSRSHKEVFSITTLLCSTKLTQNGWFFKKNFFLNGNIVPLHQSNLFFFYFCAVQLICWLYLNGNHIRKESTKL